MFKNPGVKNGVFLAISYIAFTQICYHVNPKSIFNFFQYLAFFLSVFFVYKSAIEEKRRNEGLITFSEALKVTFLTYAIGGVLWAIYYYLLINVIDTSLNDVAREVTLELTEGMVDMMGGEADQLDNLEDQLDEQNMTMSFPIIFMNYLVSLIFPGFILALIISAITKNAKN